MICLNAGFVPWGEKHEGILSSKHAQPGVHAATGSLIWKELQRSPSCERCPSLPLMHLRCLIDFLCAGAGVLMS